MKNNYYDAMITSEEIEKANFCLFVEDDSLKDFNIIKGSYVLVKKQKTIKHGNLIVLATKNGLIIKRVFFEKDNAILMCEQDKEPLIIKKENLNSSEYQILGKVIACQFAIEY